ncbi:MAG: hypothetical protein H6602_14100 [Flavobacteriales bacterium]|nr:hypothetical protein [Flavobacteriales bacterium]
MKISSGKAEDKLSTGWIGDIEAFEFFQKEWNNRSAEKSEFESLTTAFKQTIENEKLESVGDFQISVITTDNNKGKVPTVMYEEKMELISGISQKLEIGKKSIPLTFGDASSGSYGISYFISLDLFNQAVGVHFPLGDFGLLFFPKVGLGAIKYSNTDAQGFIDSVKSDYGIPMKGFERMSDSAVRLISTLSR